MSRLRDRISSTFINLHIDSCLKKKEEREKKKAVDDNDDSDVVTSLNHNRKQYDNIGESDADFDDQLDGMSLIEIKEVPGLWLIHNFISEAEEADIVQCLDGDIATPWHFSSFNGNCNSKTFGVKTQFGSPGEERCVRQNNPELGEYDIPNYLEKYPIRLHNFIRQKLKSQEVVHAKNHYSESQSQQQDSGVKHLNCQRKNLPPLEVIRFIPNECNANSYEAKSKHYLRAHFDDRILSGPILMNLSLHCSSRMTYHLASKSSIGSSSEQEIPIPLPRRSLQLVTGPARWKYRHSIKAEDILGERRLSVTWRRSEGKNTGIRHQAVSAHDNRVRNSKRI